MSHNIPLSILLVEDNPTDAMLLEQSLKLQEDDLPFTLDHADRLQTGIEMAQAKTYDIILLDLSLPDSGGLATFQNMFGAVSKVPIVILTGLDDQDLPFEAIRNGAQDYVTKETITGPALTHAIRCAVQRHKLYIRSN